MACRDAYIYVLVMIWIYPFKLKKTWMNIVLICT